MENLVVTQKHRFIQSSYFMLEVILLAALFVRVWGLSSYAYNGDEMQFIIIAKAGTWGEISKRSLLENHPPLVHIMRHYLLILTSDIFTQRLFSVAAGMFSVFGLYQIGVLLRGQALGIFYALCMAFAMLAVSTSITIRDYSFFLMFQLGAFYYFIRYQKAYRLYDLLCFAALLLLACATSFGGFLFAAACGISEAYRLQKTKCWNTLSIFSVSFLPLALLAIVLYCTHVAPGTSGPMWKNLVLVSGFYHPGFWGVTIQTLLNAYYFFVPFGGIRTIPADAVIGRLFVIAMYLGSFYLMMLQLRGLRVMRTKDYPLFCFIVLLWGIALLASLAGIHPFAANRQSYYLLPFFILPYGYLLEPWIERILNSRPLARAAAIIILIAAVVMGTSGIYMGFANELTLKQADLNAGQTFLTSHLHPHDAIITGGSAAYFYLLDSKDDGKNSYGSYADFPYSNNTWLFSGYDSPFKPHTDWKPVRAELSAQADIHAVPPEGKFWFVQYGWKNTAIWHLMECDALKGKIGDFMSREGVLIFSISQPDFTAFLKDDAVWPRCFANYKPLYIGTPFPAVKMP